MKAFRSTFSWALGVVLAGAGAARSDPPAAIPPAYHVSAGERVEAHPSGFFHTRQIDGRWWLIDPQGRLFYAVGTDHIRYQGHWCEKLGYEPYRKFNDARYGGEEKWAEVTLDRLSRWGFNTLPWGHSRILRHRGLAHTETVGMGSSFARKDALCPVVHWTGFPNVFSPEWPAHCDTIAARGCAPQRNDPWLIGYFLDNELEWYGKSGEPWGLFDEAWKLPAAHTAKQAWVAMLREELGHAGRFAEHWGLEIANFDELAAHQTPVAPRTPEARRIAAGWVREVARRYFEGCASAIRRHDPNHMILGCRFACQAPGIWDVAGKFCDVVSVNHYTPIDVERGVPADVLEQIRAWHRLAGKPLMLTEWSFPALDSGLPCTHGAGMRVDTQSQRAACFRHYQTLMFTLPFMVGSNFFMWVDEPALGIRTGFPEDSNYGLVTEQDEPYAELTRTATQLHQRVYDLHRHGEPPQPPAEGWYAPWLIALPETELPVPEAELSVTVGNLTLQGPVAGRAWRLSSGDTLLGEFYPVLHQRTQPSAWTAPDRGRITAIRRDARVMVVDMEMESDAAWPTPATPADPAQGYACGWRFWIPVVAPEARADRLGWFSSKCLWVENTGTQVMRLASVYHYLMPSIGGDSADDELLPLGVPDYHRRGAGWIDTRLGLGVAVWFPATSRFLCYYRKKEVGSFHPDLFQPIDAHLQPGQRLTIDSPRAFFFPLHDLTREGFAAATRQIESQVMTAPEGTSASGGVAKPPAEQ